jgi:hypothetical protein
VWIPVALALGIAGSVVAALPGLHALGKSFVLEGVIAALAFVGAGAAWLAGALPLLLQPSD